MKALVIADRAPGIDIAATCREQAADIVITLGDLERADLLGLTRVTHIPKIGVYGIHRSGTYMEELEILNVHMVTREYGGRTFGGFQGCVRYKKTLAPSCAHSKRRRRCWRNFRQSILWYAIARRVVSMTKKSLPTSDLTA